MSDWVDDEIQKAKEKRERGERDYQRRLLDKQAIRIKGPHVWDNLVKCVGQAVNRFNAEQGDENQLEMLLGKPPNFTIAKDSYPKIELEAALDIDRETITYTHKKTLNRGAQMQEESGAFYIAVDDGGQPYLTDNEEEISVDKAAAKLLRPIFRLTV